jgi:ABC-type nitrate/sulfonate/bicarbonate transport system ATPase subunit
MILSVDIRQKYLAGRKIIENLEFTLTVPQIVALVGPSGCGKTTLLKLIGGLDTEFTGRIDWSATGAPRIGTVFQEPRLLPWRSVRQNLRLVLPSGADPAASDQLLHWFGLWPFRDHWASQLSLGMARRLAIARAFVIEPDLLLLDEPFVSLDEAMAASAHELLLEVWQSRPTAVLLVTHDLVEAASLADRVLLLSSGPARLIADLAVPPAQRRAGRAEALETVRELRRIAGTS